MLKAECINKIAQIFEKKKKKEKEQDAGHVCCNSAEIGTTLSFQCGNK